MASDHYRRIYAVVHKIPRGRVASYGQIAELAGMPRHARQVGYALHHLPDDAGVPWQRVLNASGEVAKRAYPEDARWQRDLLEDEGVEFDVRGRVLPRFFWKPRGRRRRPDYLVRTVAFIGPRATLISNHDQRNIHRKDAKTQSTP